MGMRRAGSRGDGSLTSSGCTRTDSRRSSKRGHRTGRRRDQAGSAYSSVSLKKDDDSLQREEWDDKEEEGGRGERSQPWSSLSRSSIPENTALLFLNSPRVTACSSSSPVKSAQLRKPALPRRRKEERASFRHPSFASTLPPFHRPVSRPSTDPKQRHKETLDSRRFPRIERKRRIHRKRRGRVWIESKERTKAQSQLLSFFSSLSSPCHPMV